MKYKYVLRNSLYLDEELQNYFNEMSKKGWRLDFVGYYYRFVRDDHQYKYQIDYTPLSDEYKQVLDDLGYKEIVSGFNDFRIYENDDVNSADLNTEFIFNKNNKIKQFRPKSNIFSLFVGIFILYLTKFFISESLQIGMPYLYFHGFSSIVFPLFLLCLGLGMTFVSLTNLMIVFALKKDKSIRILKKINMLKDYIIMIAAILFLAYCIYYIMNYGIVKFLLSCGPIVLIMMILQKVFPKANDEKLRYFWAIILGLSFLFTSQIFPFEEDNSSHDEGYVINENVISKDSYYTIIINEMDVNYVQKDVKIKKTQYKDKIFQYIIILTDYETQKNIEYEDFLKNDDIYTFEETGIQYRSYKKALAQFKKDGNYYINERYVIKVTNQTIQTRYNNLKDNDYEKLFES